MSVKKPTYEELEARLAEAEAAIEALHSEQVDAVVGKEHVFLLRLEEAEESLRKSEEKFRTLAEFTFDWEYWTDPEYNFIYISPSVERITGYRIGEFLEDKGLLDRIVYPEDRSQWDEHLKIHTQTERMADFSEMEFRIVTREGVTRWISHICRPMFDEHGAFLGRRVSNRDISERKQAEEEIRKRAYDLSERIKELNALYAFSDLIEKPGITLPEIYQGLVDIIPSGLQYPEITCARLIIYDQIFRTGNFLETPWKQNSPVFAHGKRLGTLEVGYLEERPERDEGPFLKEELELLHALTKRVGRTTERILAEQDLLRSNTLFQTLAQVSPVGIFRSNLKGECTYINERMQEIVGIPSEQAIGKGWSGAIHPKDREFVLGEWDKCVKEKRMCHLEHRFLRPDGVITWVMVQAMPVQDTSGGINGYVGAVTDITERKRAEEALQKAHDELEERVKERTFELMRANQKLIHEIEERTTAEEALKKALTEIEELKNNLEMENIYLRSEIEVKHKYTDIIGQSDEIMQVLSQVELVSGTDSTVLLIGETGTGKELIAGAIHDLSQRKAKPMVKVNCAALPATLIESELFGREKGAYTGALSRQKGRFEVADGSTILLDEISELPLELQAKLLRVIESSEFERLGSSHTIRVNVRVIAATNRDLSSSVQKGTFREDLYYRLNVFPITIPPLRQRTEDIPLLVWSFVKEFESTMKKRIVLIPQKGMEELQRYPWPGNVRELRNVIERAMILSKNSTLQVQIALCLACGTWRNHLAGAYS